MDDVGKMIEVVKESIIVTRLPNGQSGSGFFINDRGLLITNKHTVELNTYMRITPHNSKETDATVVYSDNDIDFAFAVAGLSPTKPIPLADSSQVREGDQVFAIGHPYGYDFTVSKGIVSCKSRIVKGIEYIQTDVPINPGNSGGPLVNIRGEAVGINTWVVGDADNMSFAIPVNSVKATLGFLNQHSDRLLQMYYCPVCGALDDQFIKTSKGEYCRNCGTQRWEKPKPQEQAAAAQTTQAVNVGVVNCPNCNTANDQGSNFCKNCGQKMK